jgi:hypothetical protein
MDIRRSFEILELHHAATEAEARQAYKDIVNVWHPDRFYSNPRLKQKAEKKLKEVNEAYEMIKVFFQHDGHDGSKIHETVTHRSNTEIAAEVGTGIVLSACSYISAKLRNIVDKD